MSTTNFITPFSWSYWASVGTAILCGGIIGLERQLKGKPAGLRVCILIVLATDIFVSVSRGITTEAGDPSRVMAAVVSGVGFLGGGVILARHHRIQGVTTATTIWILAAIGTVVGNGQYYAAIASSLVVASVAIFVDILEGRGIIKKKEIEPDRDQL